MAFRSDKALAEAYEELKHWSRKLDAAAVSAVNRLNSTVETEILIGFGYSVKAFRDNMASLAATPGLAQYARDQENDQSYDVVAEYNAMIAAADAVTSWMQTNIPKDADGYILAWKFGPTDLTQRTFTPAQTAPLQTLAQALSDSIV